MDFLIVRHGGRALCSQITSDISLLLQVGFELSGVRQIREGSAAQLLLSFLGHFSSDRSTEVPEHPGDAGDVGGAHPGCLLSPGRALALRSPPVLQVNPAPVSAAAAGQVRWWSLVRSLVSPDGLGQVQLGHLWWVSATQQH